VRASSRTAGDEELDRDNLSLRRNEDIIYGNLSDANHLVGSRNRCKVICTFLLLYHLFHLVSTLPVVSSELGRSSELDMVWGFAGKCRSDFHQG
jgi:hypothetical protein